MQVAAPAILKPGVTVESLPGPRDTDVAMSGAAPLVRGTALIFWDPKNPSKKLDAIDTDQITPAADCVSESLATLDERWKAGSFRYLMPDFRTRVHRGETFVIAGDRFAIGSSREMSPAGLKAIAEEVGLEMVIICGNNMGDIFRRNSFNLGLHVVQSPEAVADARDGDEFTFDPVSRQVANVTQAKSYSPVPLSAKEDEIRQSGGIFALGRREFVSSVLRKPEIVFPDADLARTMSSTAQIVWAHRVDKDADVTPGATVRVYADSAAGIRRHRAVLDSHVQSDHRRQLDLSAAGGGRQRSLRLHRQTGRRQADGDRPAVRVVPSHRKTVLRDAGRRHLPFLFSGAGPGPAGPVHSRRRFAQPRLRRVRRGRDGCGIDDARVRVVDGLHLLHDGEGAPRHLPRQAQSLGHRQGHRSRAAAPMGRQAVPRHVGGTRGRRQAAADRVSKHHRQHDGGGRSAERHIRAGRNYLRLVSRKGHHQSAVSAVHVRCRCATSKSTKPSTSATSRR